MVNHAFMGEENSIYEEGKESHWPERWNKLAGEDEQILIWIWRSLGYIMYGKRTIWDFKPNKKRKIAFLCRWNWFIYSFLIHRIPYESSLCGGILAWPLYLLCFSSEFLGSIISGDMNTVDQFRSKEKFSLNINLAKESDFDADIRDTTICGWLAGCDVERYTLWKRVSIYFLH